MVGIPGDTNITEDTQKAQGACDTVEQPGNIHTEYYVMSQYTSSNEYKK